ncbi:hypothetical protein HK098_006174 [Nowakowskiella sp. JEL0407]|nr:hypothetical protein HK098_006174 [Nowakowskiella sp. JEL0407]
MDPDDIIAIQALFSLQNSSDLALTVNAETIPIEIIMPNDNTTSQFDPLISMKEYMQWDLHKSQLNSDEGLDNYEDKIEQFDDQDEGIIMQEFCRARNKRVVDGRIRKTSKKIRKSTLKSGEVPQLRTVQRLRKLDDSGNKFNGSGPILVSQSFPERKGQTDDQKVKDLEFGLSASDAESRLLKYGYNTLTQKSGPSAFKVLMSNLFNPMNFVLIIAIILAGAVKDFVQVIVLGVIIVTNAAIGFWQEYKSERTMAALKNLASPTARVLRDGKLESVSSKIVVPGDIVFLEEGDQVPADLRLFEAVNLSLDEILLTGESVPISKTSGMLINETTTLNSPNESTIDVLNSKPQIPLGDRKNIAFSSTIVTNGRGKGIVVSTGFQTEVGNIANLLQNAETKTVPVSRSQNFRSQFLRIIGWGVEGDGKTPLQHTMDRMMLVLLGCAIIIAAVVFGAQKFRFDHETAIYAIAVAIAIVPEGLPAVLTVTFAIGVRTMAKQKALVRKIASVEALGMVTNICSDKTGTLTEGKMSVKECWVSGNRVSFSGTGLDPSKGDILFNDVKVEQDFFAKELAAACGLCNNSILHHPRNNDHDWEAIGDPTEIALQVMAHRLKFIKDEEITKQRLEFVHEFPFDPTLKRMSVVYSKSAKGDDYLTTNGTTSNGNAQFLLKRYLKGAYESVLSCCDGYYDENGSICRPVTSEFKQVVEENMKRLASQGLRVLAIAHRLSHSQITELPEREKDENRYIFLGLVGMYDPPRASSAESVRICKNAGIVVHMATGDHIDTATVIAKQIGILEPGREDLVTSAAHFESLTIEEIDEMPQLPLVIARCSPETKMKFIDALHRRKKFVAMTGDGTNDAPAIKLADIGIAMGLNGSDVAKEASDIVLTDDNFATIVEAVREGRRIYANIVRLALSFLSTNVAEIVALVLALGIRSVDDYAIFPMSPVQILWINLMTSTPLALGLAGERASPDLMIKLPRGTRKSKSGALKTSSSSIFTAEFNADNMVFGSIAGIVSLGGFMVSLYTSPLGASINGKLCNSESEESALAEECTGVYRSRSVIFLTLGFILLIHGWNCRHERKSLFALPVFPRKKGNMTLVYGIILAFVLLLIPVYIPFINTVVFKQKPIDWEWAIIAGGMVTFVLLSEIYKAVKRWYYKEENVGDVEAIKVLV